MNKKGAGAPHKYGEALKYLKLGIPESIVDRADSKAKQAKKTRTEVIVKTLDDGL